MSSSNTSMLEDKAKPSVLTFFVGISLNEPIWVTLLGFFLIMYV
jgi:hypothetical protein